jgi:phage shock protein E
MSKDSKHKQKNNPLNTYILASIGLLAIVLVALMGSTNTTSNTSSINELITPSDYLAQYEENNKPHLLLDVRTPEEFATGHIPGAVNISVESLQSRLSEVSNDAPIIVYCRSGNRSAVASKILSDANYSTIFDMGGIIDWTSQGLPVE